MENKEFIDTYLDDTREIVARLDTEEISKFINILFHAWKKGKKVITCGNGGSSSTASHFAGDLLKTVVNDSSMKEISKNKGFKAICLNDNPAALTAWINDSGWDKAYSGLLHTLMEEGDVLLLVSVHGGSGWSGNVVEAMKTAKQKKAKILGLAGFDGGKMKEMGDACIVIPKDSTPHVEGLHGVVQHLVVFRLKEMIKEYSQKMKFFADTANVDEIDYCFSVLVNDGITTNPKIMETTGDLSRGIIAACRGLIDRYPDVPVSLETDLGGMPAIEIESKVLKVKDTLLSQADMLAGLGDNVVIKIPICSPGLLAVEELKKKGIKTNVTACMTPYQALKAAEAGATYVSLFANRMLDCHIIELSGHDLNVISRGIWKQVVADNKEKYFEIAWEMTLKEIAYTAKVLEEKYSTELIVGSIRSPEDIHRIAKARPHIITIPTKIVKGLNAIDDIKCVKRSIISEGVSIGNSIIHPMTTYTLDEFEQAALAYKKK